MKKIFKNSIINKVLSAIAVSFFGYILLNLTFLFDALYQGIIRRFFGFFIPLTPDSTLYWFPLSMHGSFVVVIGIISLFVFRTKTRVLFKAIYMSVPVAVVLVTTGIFLYQWQILSFSVGSLLCIGILYYFYRTKQPWIYYYTVIFWASVLAIFTLFGGEL